MFSDLRALQRARIVLARPPGGTALMPLGDVPRQAEVGAGDLEQLRTLAGIAHVLGRAHAMQRLAVILVASGHGGGPLEFESIKPRNARWFLRLIEHG